MRNTYGVSATITVSPDGLDDVVRGTAILRVESKSAVL
jgi:hypothetical protein